MSQTLVRHGRTRGEKLVRPYSVAASQTFKYGDLVNLNASGLLTDMLAVGGDSGAGTLVTGMALGNAEDFYDNGPMYQRQCPVEVFTESTEYLICLGTDADPPLAYAWNADFVTTIAAIGIDSGPIAVTINRITASPYTYHATPTTANGMAIIVGVQYNAIQNQGTNRGRPVVSDNFPDVWVRFPAARRIAA